jgi:FkbM family methyltransferase
MKALIKVIIINFLKKRGYEFTRIKETPPKLAPIYPLLVRWKFTREKRPLSVVIVGANDGVTVDPLYPSLQPDWSGLAIEANPVVFQTLKKNYEKLPLIKCVNVAVAPNEGKMTLYVGSDSQRGSLSAEHGQVGARGGTTERLEVATAPLAKIFADNNISRIDIFQCDVEGLDSMVLRLLLKTNVRPSVIHFEHAVLDKGDYELLCGELAGAGYSLLPIGVDTICLYDQDWK